MGMYWLLAWRNMGRNRKRTSIALSSVGFAVLLVLFMRSMQWGSYYHMIENTVRLSTGHLQIQHQEYEQQPSMDHSFRFDPQWANTLSQMPGVQRWIPRLEGYALAASAKRSLAIHVRGVDPSKEAELKQLEKHLLQGR